MIIDRFEGEFAVLETEGGMMNVHRSFLPSFAREGDVVRYDGSGYGIDRESTEDLRSEVRNRLHKLLTEQND